MSHEICKIIIFYNNYMLLIIIIIIIIIGVILVTHKSNTSLPLQSVLWKDQLSTSQSAPQSAPKSAPKSPPKSAPTLAPKSAPKSAPKLVPHIALQPINSQITLPSMKPNITMSASDMISAHITTTSLGKLHQSIPRPAFANDTHFKPLQSPKNVVTVAGINSCYVSWDPVPGATSYSYVYSNILIIPSMKPIIVGNVTNATINNLTNNNPYYIWIYAIGDNIQSMPTLGNMIIPIMPTTIPIIYPPSNITSILGSDNKSIIIDWTRSNATSYSYILSKNSTKPNVPINGNILTTSPLNYTKPNVPINENILTTSPLNYTKPNVPTNENILTTSPLNYTKPINVGNNKPISIKNLSNGTYYIWLYGSANNINSIVVPLNPITISGYNDQEFNASGYNAQGFNASGYNANGLNSSGLTEAEQKNLDRALLPYFVPEGLAF